MPVTKKRIALMGLAVLMWILGRCSLGGLGLRLILRDLSIGWWAGRIVGWLHRWLRRLKYGLDRLLPLAWTAARRRTHLIVRPRHCLFPSTAE